MDVDEIITDPSLKQALELSNQTREQAIALLDFVSEAPPTSSDLQLQMSKRQKILYTYLAQLRGLHRSAQMGARETKAQTAEARQEVDRLHLQLQNLYYEQRHLQGEIAACESYEYVPHPFFISRCQKLTASKVTNINNSPSSPSQNSWPTVPSLHM